MLMGHRNSSLPINRFIWRISYKVFSKSTAGAQHSKLTGADIQTLSSKSFRGDSPVGSKYMPDTSGDRIRGQSSQFPDYLDTLYGVRLTESTNAKRFHASHRVDTDRKIPQPVLRRRNVAHRRLQVYKFDPVCRVGTTNPEV